MTILDTEIPEVKIIEPKIFGDARGWFSESFSQKGFSEKVQRIQFVQDNESCSVRGTLRGLHYQLPPHAQGKLVRVTKGSVYDVAVDIRRGSPTFGRYVGVELTELNRRQLFIPRGFAHGFLALEEGTVFQYKCDDYYAPQSEGGIAWDDPEIGIKWPLGSLPVIVSDKDKLLPRLSQARLFDYNEKLYL